MVAVGDRLVGITTNQMVFSPTSELSSLGALGYDGRQSPGSFRVLQVGDQYVAATWSGVSMPGVGGPAWTVFGVGSSQENLAANLRYVPTATTNPATGLRNEATFNPYMPPMPHPDASNQAIGPNLGGTDAVSLPGDMPTGTGAGSGGTGGGGLGSLLLIGGVVLLVVVAMGRK